MSLLYRTYRKRRRSSYVLIGDGFDELEVVYLLHKFRRAGLHIKSVSLKERMVYSRQGVGIQADFQLVNQPIDPEEECLLILPTGGHNEVILRHDARVKSLLKSLDMGKGRIAVTDADTSLAHDVHQLVKQGAIYKPYAGQDLEDFINVLTSSQTN